MEIPRLNHTSIKNLLSLPDDSSRPLSRLDVLRLKNWMLNEPFYMMALNLGIWIAAAFFFSYRINSLGEPQPVVLRMFLLSLNTGLIAAVMSFFLLEHVSQGHVARFFFPEGGLHKTPKTIRNRIVVRLMALLFACNTIPFISFIQLYYLSAPGVHDAADALHDIRVAILTNSIFFIVIGFIITMFVHMNFDAPIREIIQALKDIRKGNFDRKVPVRSNDEIGYTADVINEMTTGLKERDQMRHSLFLAKEIVDMHGGTLELLTDTHRNNIKFRIKIPTNLNGA